MYKSSCQGICIVSSDSDFTALASRIREEGKAVYGIGESRTPGSFRLACTKFYLLQKKTPKEKENGASSPGNSQQSNKTTSYAKSCDFMEA